MLISNMSIRRKSILRAIRNLSLSLLLLGTAGAQTDRPAQATRGKAAYSELCANCHGADLKGGSEAPGLTGPAFLAKWKARAVGELQEKIRSSMPPDRPGTMSRDQVADVVAFLAAASGLPAGPPATAAPRASDPPPVLEEGNPIERRPTEKSDNWLAFPEQTRAPYHRTPGYRVTTLIDKLPAPWSLAFLTGGKILLTLRLPGSLRVLNSNGELSAPVAGVRELASPGAADIGLLDVVLDPDFANNRRIFLTFFDYIDGTDSNTYVARARFDQERLAIHDAKVIFRAQPAIPSKRLGAKTGGRIAIAKDGTLFVTTGDRSDSPPWDVAQKLDNHLGKVLHITRDGAPAPDNPFLGKPGVLPEIWAYGLRSPEGLAFDPATGSLWLHEHGPRGGDELNRIERGKNYGWPVMTHGIDYPGTPIGEAVRHKDGMEEPVYYWDPVIAPSGLAFYTGSLFPEWRGSLLVGGLRSRSLERLAMAKDKVFAEEPLLMELQARIRDVRVGPDGAVYVLTDSGAASMSPRTPLEAKLVKLTPK
jgi:glucose/arabinose dehydrogenase